MKIQDLVLILEGAYDDVANSLRKLMRSVKFSKLKKEVKYSIANHYGKPSLGVEMRVTFINNIKHKGMNIQVICNVGDVILGEHKLLCDRLMGDIMDEIIVNTTSDIGIDDIEIFSRIKTYQQYMMYDRIYSFTDQAYLSEVKLEKRLKRIVSKLGTNMRNDGRVNIIYNAIKIPVVPRGITFNVQQDVIHIFMSAINKDNVANLTSDDIPFKYRDRHIVIGGRGLLLFIEFIENITGIIGLTIYNERNNHIHLVSPEISITSVGLDRLEQHLLQSN